MTFEFRLTSRRLGRFLVLLLACLALPLLVTCGRDTPTQSRTAVPARVVVTPVATDLASAGQTVRLNARALDDAGQEVSEAPVAWRSTDASVARVSADGVVTAVGEGSALITAMAGQKTAQAKVTVADPVRAALRALYEATGGANWKNSDNWLSARPVGDWYGVIGEPSGPSGISQRRTSAGGLTRLDLSGNGLTGEIPPVLGSLAGLRYLDLSDNALSGAIPPALGNLSSLETLKLHDNRLSGEIPSELGNLESLRELSLHGNGQLTGALPLSLANLDRLETLSLSGTQLCAPTDAAFQNWLQGIANRTGIFNCGNDTDGDRNVLLALYNATDGPNWTTRTNWLSTRPLSSWHGVGVNAAGRVDSLILEDNALAGPIPASLGSLAGLVALDASGNQLSGSIPEELGDLSGLVTLDLSNNALTGPIPPALFSLPNLVTLELSGNRFTDIPDTDIPDTGTPVLTDRDVLVALYNATDGENWTNNTNWLSDRPLGEWHGVRVNAEGRVEGLDLSANQLSGPIPTELASLTKLTHLYLYDNQLSGPIPAEIASLTNLTELDLSENQLSGPIPSELGSLTKLEDLWLFGNQLSGPLPGTFTGLTNLERLSIEGTGLCAPTDAAFQAWLRGVDDKSGVVNCAGSSPDLIVASPSVSDDTLTTGQSFTLSASVRNQGTGRSASTILRYYRSSNSTISSSDTQVGTDAVSALAASGTSAESISLSAPSSVGTYYYGACVDEVSGESDTGNNCSTGVRVTVMVEDDHGDTRSGATSPRAERFGLGTD